MKRSAGKSLENAVLKKIRTFPFVKSVQIAEKKSSSIEAMLTIETETNKFSFQLEIKKSFLSRVDLDSIVAIGKKSAEKLLLFAPYVPLPAAEKLIAAGINFADQQGNIHLDLLPDHLVSRTGRTQDSRFARRPRLTRAAVQFLFGVANSPESLTSTVRELAKSAGVSLGTVSTARKALFERGLFASQEGGEALATNPKELRDMLVRGYLDLLRPKIMIGRYRAPYRTPRELLEKGEQSRLGGRLALTGSAAAYQLQKVYRTSDISLFVEKFDEAAQREWRLIPAEDGQVVLLEAFGETVFWREVGGIPLANPWLIYAEMYADPDPRSHEAAEELRAEYLE